MVSIPDPWVIFRASAVRTFLTLYLSVKKFAARRVQKKDPDCYKIQTVACRHFESGEEWYVFDVNRERNGSAITGQYAISTHFSGLVKEGLPLLGKAPWDHGHFRW